MNPIRLDRLSALQQQALATLANGPTWCATASVGLHPSTINALYRLGLVERRRTTGALEASLTSLGSNFAAQLHGAPCAPCAELELDLTPAQEELITRLQNSRPGAWVPADPRSARVLAREGGVAVRPRSPQDIATSPYPRRWTVEVQLRFVRVALTRPTLSRRAA